MTIVTSELLLLRIPKTGGEAVLGAVELGTKTLPTVVTGDPASTKFPQEISPGESLRWSVTNPVIMYEEDVAAHKEAGIGSQAYENAYHDVISDVPPQFKHLPLLATVRNPLHWYVSWFNWWRDRDGYRKTYLRGHSEDFEAFVRDCPGLYMRYHKRYYGEDLGSTHFIRTECQYEDFIVALQAIRGRRLCRKEYDVYSALFLRPMNVNFQRTKDYPDYYTEDLVQFVIDHDSYLFDNFYPERDFTE